MIANLKPYPAMKDSRVEWLGEVPTHWEIRRLRNVTDMRVSNVDKHVKEDETSVRLCNYVDVYKNVYINEQMDFMEATATDEEIERFRLERDDVLITKDSETWDDIGVPALVTVPASDLILGYHLALLRSRSDKLAGAYLLRALQSKGLAYQFHIEAKGVTRYGLSHADIKSIWLPLPPLSEQTAIVRFLDHADRRIGRYIRAKQKLIALLVEQKQAIIHRAVTGLIDVRTGQPYPAYKPSGVEWLGDVAAHWEAKKLKTVVQFIDGDRGPNYPGERDYGAEGIPFFSSRDIVRNRLKLDKVAFISEKKFRSLGRGKLQTGDLIITVRGTIGSIAVFDGEEHETGFINAQMMIIRPSRAIKSEFLHHVAQSSLWRKQLSYYSYGSAQQQLSGQILRNIYLAAPNVREQEEIVAHLHHELAKVDSAIHSTVESIALLQEYKSMLISNVVTGKLDVREAAANLPSDAATLDPLDSEGEQNGGDYI